MIGMYAFTYNLPVAPIPSIKERASNLVEYRLDLSSDRIHYVKFEIIPIEPEGHFVVEIIARVNRADYFANENKEMYDSSLTGTVDFPIQVFIFPAREHPSLRDRLNHIGRTFPYQNEIPIYMAASDYSELKLPTYSHTYNSVLARLETESPQNLLADLSLGLNSLAHTQTKTKGYAQGYLLRAKLYLKANQPTKADKALTTAAPAVQANPQLITSYNQLRQQIENPTSPNLE